MREAVSEAVSLFVSCQTQEEVDELLTKLAAGGGAPSQCGWLQDKFGLSWRIVPSVLLEMMMDKDPAKSERVMDAMLQMIKLDNSKLNRPINKVERVRISSPCPVRDRQLGTRSPRFRG